MIRFQVIEREGADLRRTLIRAMRDGNLRTFVAMNRGRKVVHTNVSIPGWMTWFSEHGVILCEVVSPRKPGGEWRFFNAFLGRLADRFPDQIQAIHVQFPSARTEAGTPRRKRRRAQRRR